MRIAVAVLALLLASCASTPQRQGLSNADLCDRMGVARSDAVRWNTCINNIADNDARSTPDIDFGRVLKAVLDGLAVREQARQALTPAPLPAPVVCRWIGPNWVCQ